MKHEGYRLGEFDIDLDTSELWKDGARTEIQKSRFGFSRCCLKTPEKLVSRSTLHRHLWPDDVVVDYDNNLNAAVRKLREALRDDVKTPRYVETLPRRGYRLIADLTPLEESGGAGMRAPHPPWLWFSAGSLSVVLLLALYCTTLV